MRSSRGDGLTKMSWLQRVLHLDGLLLGLLLLAGLIGVVILYSAADQQLATVKNQLVRFGLALGALVFIAQIPPGTLRRWSPWLYLAGIVLLAAVLIFGEIGKGARRWLDVGIRFQPSELMKLALPMMIAWFLSNAALPPRWPQLLAALALVLLPIGLILAQPDLGTSILVAASGIFVIYMAGLRWRFIFGAAIAMVPLAVLMWFFGMHDYQKRRVLTLLDPTSDPLGSGYHIIQSTIAWAPAACSARAGCRAPSRTWTSCPSATPISSSPCSARNSAWWA
jgi:rod shape determining protein RodA